ncbi:molybdopterin-dependent oxidoreductase [Halodesulfovibrio marinisediminis]|uniref:Anaerobic selenocysteine-containing dehydrogenase n=1 Tax=Halodesulfovibrio marinisediminis DSM 17456 TaxID=1121457 RepID=A0A1N6E4C8_9BACT|nr:molybdopterin-dependent oxidoreductase [Halodesulfovibrio marinisediminis]SIN77898.1 Anaerobic selenocysteine-containing dehydrogenase [Halodesulfovibrio marinisediminis DSM 17456]
MDHISACTLDCPDCCSTIVTTDEYGRHSIKGNPAHPITQGFTCKKGKHALSRISAPDRITTPLMRNGSDFTPVSWEKALDAIAQKISTLRSTPERMLHVRGYGFRGVLADSSRYLFGQLGASKTHGALCDNAMIEACIRDFGELDQNNYTELLNADCIVNWGRDVIRSSIHTTALLKDARSNGCQLFSISPMSPEEGMRIHQSDTHIQIRPGTDRFLATAVINRLIQNGIADKILSRTSNGPEFVNFIKSLDEQKLLQTCGVKPDEISLLAAIYGNKDFAVSSILGWGLQRYIYGGENVRYINALSMLSGNVGKKGAGSYGGVSTGRNFDSTWRSGGKKSRSLLTPKLADEILAAGDIEFLWCDGTNAINQTPEAIKMADAFCTIDMVVVVDAFINDTAKQADIILPCALMYEREDVLGSYFHNYIQYSAKVFEPTGDTRTDYDIISDIASRLSIPMPQKDDILTSALNTEPITNLTKNPLTEIRKKGFLPTDRPNIAFKDMTFSHPDGKYCLPDPVLHEEPEFDSTFPLSLLSLINKDYEHSQIPAEEQQEQLKAHIHPTTLTQYNIIPNEHAHLISPIGKIQVLAVADTAVHPESVIIRRGGWMMFDRCANTIIESHVTDLGGNAAFYSQRVRLECIK